MVKREPTHWVGGVYKKLETLVKIGLDFKWWRYRAQWNAVRKYKIDTDFPTHLDVEPASACNLRCIMCPQSFPDQKFSRGLIELDLYHKIIDEGSERGAFSLKLHWRGEPILHPNIVDMVSYAKDKGFIDVWITTNGLTLDEKMSNGLIDAGLDRMAFSIDGVTKETYEKIRKGSDFESVIKNTEKFIELRNKRGLKKPYIDVRIVVMKENKHEVEVFKKKWSKVAEFIAVKDYSNRGDSEDRGIYKYVKVGRVCCPEPFSRLVIGYDGTVMMCCADWTQKIPLGNVKDQSLYEIWHGETLRKIKELHRQRRLDEIVACKDCYFSGSYEWKKLKKK